MHDLLNQDATLFKLLEQNAIQQAHQVQSILMRAKSWGLMLDERAVQPSGPPRDNKQSQLRVFQALVQRVVIGRDTVPIKA